MGSAIVDEIMCVHLWRDAALQARIEGFIKEKPCSLMLRVESSRHGLPRRSVDLVGTGTAHFLQRGIERRTLCWVDNSLSILLQRALCEPVHASSQNQPVRGHAEGKTRGIPTPAFTFPKPEVQMRLVGASVFGEAKIVLNTKQGTVYPCLKLDGLRYPTKASLPGTYTTRSRRTD